MYDVVVIGVGSMGSAACYQLARRGRKVLGLEQFSIVHEEGSHTGQSRLIRKAYFEHPSYVPLLQSAYHGWRALEEAGGEQLYWQTGIAYFALPHDELIRGIQESARQYAIPLSKKSPTDFPEFKLPGDFTCLLEPEAGFISPERTIRTLARLARHEGADIRENQQVVNWEVRKDEVIVTTKEQEFTAKKLIITAGAYANELLDLPLKMTRQYLGWAPTSQHQLGDFSCWVIGDERLGIFYGFPAGTGLEGPEGMKIGYHRPGESLGEPERPDQERALLDGVLQQYFTDELQVGEMKSCKYAYSPDEHFILDHLPDTEHRVIIATGFSGHGFKFVPVIGEVLADLAMEGKTQHPIDFLSLKRFH